MSYLDYFFTIYASLLVFAVPYTKVEESFNMQAVHDILYHGVNLTKFDHKEFPGVVPRTFIGPLTIASISYSINILLDLFSVRKCLMQYIIRVVLATLVAFCNLRFKRALAKYFTPNVARFYQIICITQFHYAFYSSRLLPNIFALSLTLIALAHFLQHNYNYFIFFAGATILIFRSELILLFGPLILVLFLERKVNFWQVIATGTGTLMICLSATILVDSYFWGRWTWPEGEVFYYNTFQNMSHHWGTMPFWWYFYSVLPRCCLLSLLFIPIGVYSQFYSSLRLFVPACSFLFIYSFLPHKELRFIIYVVPILNSLSAVGIDYLVRYNSRSTMINSTLSNPKSVNLSLRKLFNKIIPLCLFLHFFINILLSITFLLAALNNYPGGDAMRLLHDKFYFNSTTMRTISQPEIHVHICNYAAQTGVTRFLQESPHWIYNKTEGMENSVEQLARFHFILKEIHDDDHYDDALRHLLVSHESVATFNAFKAFTLHWPYLHTIPKLTLLKQRA